MGTAIEKGIAVPHARLNLIKRPLIAFGRSTGGIEWDSPDGQPTRFIFLILTSPDDDWIQVQILGSIARVMANEEIHDRILHAQNAQEIWVILREAFTILKVRK